MSHRLLRGGFVVVALWALVASEVGAKPPDLPADVKDVVEPTAAPDIEVPSQTLPVPPPCAAEGMGLPLPPGALPPVPDTFCCPTSQNVTIRIELPIPQVPESESSFYRLPLADRQLMTSCALFSMHPLLGLIPANNVMYWPMEMRETLEEKARKNDSTVEIHSIDDKVVVTGRVHDVDEATEVMRLIRSTVPGARNIINLLQVTDEQQVKPGGMVAESNQTAVQPTVKCEEKKGSLMLGFGFTLDELVVAPSALYLADIDAEVTPDSIEVSVPLFSPLLITVKATGLTPSQSAKKQKCPRSTEARGYDIEAIQARLDGPTVLENLERLEEAEVLFDQAREFLRTGRVAAALDLFEKIVRKCPGSRLDEMVQTVLLELFSKPAGASEEAEQGTEEQDALPAFDGWGMLRRVFEPWKGTFERERLLLEDSENHDRFDEWEQNWLKNQPSHLTYDHIDGKIQYFDPAAEKGVGPGAEPGAQVMADGLLKAARLALEAGDAAKTKTLARQAYALDPVRMQQDPDLYSLYLLAIEPERKGPRVNNFGPAGRD